jgi:hypothetical protein
MLTEPSQGVCIAFAAMACASCSSAPGVRACALPPVVTTVQQAIAAATAPLHVTHFAFPGRIPENSRGDVLTTVTCFR